MVDIYPKANRGLAECREACTGCSSTETTKLCVYVICVYGGVCMCVYMYIYVCVRVCVCGFGSERGRAINTCRCP